MKRKVRSGKSRTKQQQDCVILHQIEQVAWDCVEFTLKNRPPVLVIGGQGVPPTAYKAVAARTSMILATMNVKLPKIYFQGD